MSALTERLIEIRATRPKAVAEALARRVRRPLLGADGRLFRGAADQVRGQPLVGA